MQGRGDQAMPQRQNGFDQASDAGSRIQMSHVTLDRTQRTGGWLRHERLERLG